MTDMEHDIKKKLIKTAKNIYKDEPSGHDFGHVERVLNYCKLIHNNEGGNWNVIFVSALFHDVHRVMQSKIGTYVSPEESITEVKKVLEEFKQFFSEEEYDKILNNIKLHEDKRIKIYNNIELVILQDADLLDALGKNGLKRTKKYCKYHNIPFYDPEPLNSPDYIVDIHPISTSHFLFRTLIPQYDLLRTKTSQQIADKDKKLLYEFIEDQKRLYSQSLIIGKKQS